MNKSNMFSFFNIPQFLLDITVLVLSYYASFFIASRYTELYSISRYTWILFVLVPMYVLIMGTLGMYDMTTSNDFSRILRNTIFSLIFTGLIISASMYIVKENYLSRIYLSTLICTSIIFLLLQRLVFNRVMKKINSAYIPRTVIISFSQEVTEKLEFYLSHTNIEANIIGYVKVDSDDSAIDDKKYLGKIDNLKDILIHNVIDQVIFTLPKDYFGQVEKYVFLCEDMGITVRILMDLYHLNISKTSFVSLGNLPMITFNSVSLNKRNLFIKRVIDIIGAIIGLAITGILSIIIVPLIKLDSSGKVIFSQDRVGLNGRIFKLYKFRTMRIDAEEHKKELMEKNQVEGGFMFKIKDDPRITRIGKFLRATSLDEFPQFFNVLKGDMSLVGTRPPTPDEVEKYEVHHYRRISMKPGITGIWQTSGRSNITNFDEVVKMDTLYIDEWTILLDFKIIFRTVMAAFQKNGAF